MGCSTAARTSNFRYEILGTFSTLADLLRVSVLCPGSSPLSRISPAASSQGSYRHARETSAPLPTRTEDSTRLYNLWTRATVSDRPTVARHVRTRLLQVIPERPRRAPRQAILGPHSRCAAISCARRLHAAPPPTSAPPTAPNPKVHRRQRSLCLIDFDHYGDAQAHEAFDAHNPPLGYRPRQNIRLRSQAAVCDKGLIISSQDQDPVQEKARDGFKDVAGSNRR